MEDFKTLLWSSKFVWARERMFSKFIDSLGTLPKKDLPPLLYGVVCFGDKQLHGKGQNCYTVHTFPTLFLSR